MINWILKKFDALTVHELYAILQLRNEVFAIEQNCVYPDMDNRDQGSYHFCGWTSDKLVAYSRILPAGVAFDDYVSIGRVVTTSSVRKKGTGKELMKRSMEQIEKLFGAVPIKIGAQVYLKKFYTALGFVSSGNIYIEDGIEHIEMIRINH
jgi:ElaA protein